MDSDFQLPPEIRDPFAEDVPENRIPDEDTQRDRPRPIDTEYPSGGEAPEEGQSPRPIDTEYPSGGEAPEEGQAPRPIDTEYPSGGDAVPGDAPEPRPIDTDYPASPDDVDFTMPPEIRDPFAE